MQWCRSRLGVGEIVTGSCVNDGPQVPLDLADVRDAGRFSVVDARQNGRRVDVLSKSTTMRGYSSCGSKTGR
jgi:hypothetical protein